MNDIHGNTLEVGDQIYIVDAAQCGSKSKRLLYGEIKSITGSKCQVFVFENKRTYSKTSSTIVKPQD